MSMRLRRPSLRLLMLPSMLSTWSAMARSIVAMPLLAGVIRSLLAKSFFISPRLARPLLSLVSSSLIEPSRCTSKPTSASRVEHRRGAAAAAQQAAHLRADRHRRAVALQHARGLAGGVVLGLLGDQLVQVVVGGDEAVQRLADRLLVRLGLHQHRCGGHLAQGQRDAVEHIRQRIAGRRDRQPVQAGRRIRRRQRLRHRQDAGRRVEGQRRQADAVEVVAVVVGDADAKAVVLAGGGRAQHQACAAGIGEHRGDDAGVRGIDLVAQLRQRFGRRPDRDVHRSGARLGREGWSGRRPRCRVRCAACLRPPARRPRRTRRWRWTAPRPGAAPRSHSCRAGCWRWC